MITIKRRTLSYPDPERLLFWSNRALEVLWLLTVVLVPLAFLGRSYGEWSSIIGSYELPKIAILRTAAGLIAVLWLVEWGLRYRLGGGTASWVPWGASPARWPGELARWLGSQPTRWTTLAVVLFLASTVLSTALSTTQSTSLWGDVPGQDSYSLYTVVSYCVLFAAIATHLKTEAQLWRLLGAVALMGVLAGGYAIFQHYGWDFLDLTEPFGHTRSTSTFGRTIFAGAVMLMTIPVTVVTAAKSLSGDMTRTGFALRAGAGAIVLSIQILGMIFIASRGPWVGTMVGLAALLALVAVFSGWRPLGRTALVLALGAIVSVIVLVSPLQTVADNAAERQEETFVLGGGPSLGARETGERLTSLSAQVAGGGLSGRTRIWGNTWDVIKERPWFAFDDLSLSFLRPLIGYGPEQFRATYLLVSPPNPSANLLPNEVAHAHNFFLHQGVETGFLGLFTAAGLFLAIFGSGIYIWLRQRNKLSGIHKLVLAGLLAVLAGRLLEQMVGTGRVSDLMVFWVLLASFAALPAVFSVPTATERIGRGSLRAGRPTSARSRSANYRMIAVIPIIKWLTVSGLVAGVVFVTWTQNAAYIHSATILDNAAEEFRDGQLDGSLASIGRSIDRTGNVPTNYERWFHVYSAHPAAGPPPDCDRPGDPPHRLCLAKQAYKLNTQWVVEHSFDYRARLALAASALDLSLLNGDTDLQDESLRLYGEAAAMVPNSWIMWNRVAEVFVSLEQPDNALEALSKSLAITGSSRRDAVQALGLQGASYRLLGHHQDALNSLDQALVLNPRHSLSLLERSLVYYEIGQSNRAVEDLNEAVGLDDGLSQGHYWLGTIFYQLGRLQEAVTELTRSIALDPQNAEAYNNLGLAFARMDSPEAAVQNFERAVTLNPGLAVAHNNLGFTLRDLGYLERAIEALDQAIELDSMLNIAYYNRALAYTLVGRDSEARQDGTRAVELGIDAVSMNAAIAEYQKRR